VSKVIQIREVPDDVHDALLAAAKDQGTSLTRYLQRELAQVARRATVVAANAEVVRETQAEVRGTVDRETILSVLHECRGH
jgi:hypothetical protein